MLPMSVGESGFIWIEAAVEATPRGSGDGLSVGLPAEQ